MQNHPKTAQSSMLVGLQESLSNQPNAKNIMMWRDLADGSLSFEEAYHKIIAQPQLDFLTVDVTGVCDLICANMCYYHPDIDLRKTIVPENTLKKAILEAVEYLNVQTLVLAGKEPLLNPKRLFSLLEFCAAMPNRRFGVGLVTNGRHIAKYWDKLQAASDSGGLDFIDISIDSGYEVQHDAIRGKEGTWDLAISAARAAVKNLPNVRVGIASVLRGDNGDGLLELLAIASPYIRHFFIIPVQPPPFSNMQPLKAEYVIAFLKRLQNKIKSLNQGNDMEITISLPGLYVLEAVEAGLFNWRDLTESHHGMIYAQTQSENHTVLYSCSVLPEQACRVARITYNGAYLSHLHFLQTPMPDTYAMGFIQKDSICNLYEKSMAPDSHFHRMFMSRQDHTCRNRPCWANCFGGWAVADNAFLTQHPLESKPNLCTKN